MEGSTLLELAMSGAVDLRRRAAWLMLCYPGQCEKSRTEVLIQLIDALAFVDGVFALSMPMVGSGLILEYLNRWRWGISLLFPPGGVLRSLGCFGGIVNRSLSLSLQLARRRRPPLYCIT